MQLGKCEKEALCLSYLTNDVIAKKLNKSLGTINRQLLSVFMKVGASNKTEAVIKALKLGLVSLEDFKVEEGEE